MGLGHSSYTIREKMIVINLYMFGSQDPFSLIFCDHQVTESDQQ